MPITPQEISTADQISGLSLSFSGTRVVYCVGPAFRAKDAHETQALWIADVGVAASARRITSGLFNDHAPKFHPVSGDVYFLSDRHKAGGKAQIYRISAGEFGGDPEPVTGTENVRGVSTFKISPDGRWLAYTSADEPAEEDEEKKETYVIIWQAPKELGRLRIIDLSGRIKDPRTVVSVDQHVSAFTWSPDSTRILYRLVDLPDLESQAFPSSEDIVSIEEDDGDLHLAFTHVVTHSHLISIYHNSVWTEPHRFYFLHTPDYTSAPALWVCETAPGATPTRVAFGDTDDAVVLVGVDTEAAVQVASGLETRIDIVGSTSFTAFQTSEDAFSGWDIRKVNDKYVFVAVRSSGVTGEPENVWSGSTVPGTKGVLSTKLSSHHEWVSGKEIPQCAPFSWSSEDGTALEGIVAYPRGQSLKNLPTVVVPHGGPYWRDTLDLRIGGANYRNLLASHGFLVLCPNYRGSLGRGTDFARAANGGMGTLDYADIESMLDEAIKRGYVDPEKVAIAGYSQGGFLSAWACTRPNSIWKAGVIGAAPTDWGSLILSSDIPDPEADLGGSAPWSPRAPQYLRGSPIRDVKNVKVPLLLIHGEKDARVPLTQAIGFMRGLIREGDKAISQASELVIYPREDHSFEERAHIEDQLTRVLAHIQKYLA